LERSRGLLVVLPADEFALQELLYAHYAGVSKGYG
jgi:hypothetical protein